MWTSGNAVRNGAIRTPGAGCEVGGVQLVDDVQVSGVEYLVNEAANDGLVLVGHRRSLTVGTLVDGDWRAAVSRVGRT
jgi:hypothetical protein